MNVDEAKEITGGLSTTSKMPCKSYSIPSCMCNIGSQLKNVKGAVCEHCYTYRYQRYAHVIEKQFERYSKLFNPQWARAMAVLIKNENNHYFRWHDSGDIQGQWHLNQILDVVRRTPDVQHWLPTLETRQLIRWVNRHGKFNQFPNLVIRLSTPMVDGKPDEVLAKRLGITNSSVTKDKTQWDRSTTELANTEFCLAKKQDGHCLECRKCWNPEQQLITYLKH